MSAQSVDEAAELGCRRAESGEGAEDYCVGPEDVVSTCGGGVLGCVVVAGPGGIVCKGSGVCLGDVAYADFRPCVGDVLGHGCAVSSSRVADDGQLGHAVSPLWVVGVSLVVGRRLVAPCGGKHPAGADGDATV